MLNLKNWISDNCLTIKGTLNNRCMLESWWINKDFFDIKNEILEFSSLLSNISFGQRLYHAFHNSIKVGECFVCSSPTKFISFNRGFRETCSIQCSGKNPNRIKKIVESHDYEKTFEKVKETNLKKYGHEYYFGSKDSQEKIKQTKLNRYGDEFFNNKEKYKNTCLIKYGEDHPEKNNTSHININDVVRLHFQENKSCVEIADYYGVAFSTITQMLHNNGTPPNKTSISRFETKIENFLIDNNIEYIKNDRKILDGKELDFFIPTKNIAIEINGIYWHSFDKKETKEQKYKHFNKFKRCKELGIRLIQFTDYELENKFNICIGILRNSMSMCSKKIRASKCKIKPVLNNEYKSFCEVNHIQGSAPASIIYGLYYQEELVSLMSFSKSRYRKDGLELIRFVNKIGYRVFGAASKLFSKIDKNNEIISYCSIDYFSGEVYNVMDFKFEGYSPPNYYYHKNSYTKPLISRIAAQKHKLKDILEIYDSSLTEYENMFNNGYKRYWNCGNGIWVYNKK